MRDHDPYRGPVYAGSASIVFGGGLSADDAVSAFGGPDSGEALVHLDHLNSHARSDFVYKFGGPNCGMRWAKLPPGHQGTVDVVIHLHGFTEPHNNAGLLAGKLKHSGLDLQSPGVTRPTLGLVPHGAPFLWTEKYKDKEDGSIKTRIKGDGFKFPALASGPKLRQFVEQALDAYAAKTSQPRPQRGRVVVTGHSGAGTALSELMQALGKDDEVVNAFYYFDASYGNDPAKSLNWQVLGARGGWVDGAIARDAKALAGLYGTEARERQMRERGGGLRIVARTGTHLVAEAAAAGLVRQLAATVPDAAVRALLHQHYRAQRVIDAQKIDHYGALEKMSPRLLADPANDLAPEVKDIAPAAPARAKSFYPDQSDAMDTITMPVLSVPERAADAPTGAAFIASLGSTKGVEREDRIYAQLRAGNMPTSLLVFHTVRTRAADKAGQQHDIEFYVTPDVLAIGSERDSVRIPMDPVTAQRVADHFKCLLPTARMVEQTYQAAASKLAFIYGNYAGTKDAGLQDASASYLKHSQGIDAQLRRPPTLLTAGHKKELVISSNYIVQRTNKETGATKGVPVLAFYGAYTAAGAPIQAGRGGNPRGWPSFAHEPRFVDYSHGVRMVWPTMQLDGQERKVADVLRDSNLSLCLAAEGPIQNPRYTLDRAGKASNAAAQALAEDDPLGLSPVPQAAAPDGAETLGYGATWDENIRNTLMQAHAAYTQVPVQVGTITLLVSPPYYINFNPNSKSISETTKKRFEAATKARSKAPAGVKKLLDALPNLAKVGKATPDDLKAFLQGAADAKLLAPDSSTQQPSTQSCRDFLKKYGIGIDCSGYTGLAINTLMPTLPGSTAADALSEPLSTSSATQKSSGNSKLFAKLTGPTDLCAGDTMGHKGHIRILVRAWRDGDNICFKTAESSSDDDIGPTLGLWRLVPDTKAAIQDFKGWRLERGTPAAAPTSWKSPCKANEFSHYKPLQRLLKAAGFAPTALAWDSDDDDEDDQGAAWALKTKKKPPRATNTDDLTQAEVTTLAGVAFTNATDLATYFHRQGNTGFIDWYNAQLSDTVPFAARGKIGIGKTVRDRFDAFWNQIPTAYDRTQISALDFAAFMAISINETGGHMWAHPEIGGKGRSDDKGAHPGLAYFFDTIQLAPQRRKASYNHLSGGKTAALLFDDADFIAAHGALGDGTRLANHGQDFGGAWAGKAYPQDQFGTAEDPSNGFIMQADFYKFRGRGVLQTTGRESYLRVINFIKKYRGTNTVLADFAKRWASTPADTAATTSSTEDWDKIFGQSEMLAKGLSLHAGGAATDYRPMSNQAATLHDVPSAKASKADPHRVGQLGSIYAMGRRISGSYDYGATTYRQRVLALLQTMLLL